MYEYKGNMNTICAFVPKGIEGISFAALWPMSEGDVVSHLKEVQGRFVYLTWGFGIRLWLFSDDWVVRPSRRMNLNTFSRLQVGSTP